MDDAGFAAFLERAIPRRAERWARRGLWSPELALETSRQEYATLFRDGVRTPDQQLRDIVDDTTGSVVGEVWYTARKAGGKVEFWIQWISVWPEHQRKGYAAEALLRLDDAARDLGAERTFLTVWMDNPGAIALYTKVGYRVSSMNMVKDVEPSSTDDSPKAGTRPGPPSRHG